MVWLAEALEDVALECLFPELTPRKDMVNMEGQGHLAFDQAGLA
jgi:hypothetical protein